MELKEMSIEQLEERKAAIATEVDAPEADLDALESEVRGINEEIETRKAEEQKRVEIRNAVAKGQGEVIKKIEVVEEKKTMTNEEIRNSEAYINAFANYCKTGDASECRSLLTDIPSQGSVPVPVFVGEIVAEELKRSEILSRIRRMEVPGIVKLNFEISAPAAEVHEEGGDPMDEEELALGIVTMVPMTLKKWVGISDEALDSMAGRAYLAYLYKEITRGIIKAREAFVVTVIENAPTTASATAPAVAEYTRGQNIAIDDFVQARALLSSAAGDLVIICKPSDYAAYRSLQLSAQYAADPFDGLTVLFSDSATDPIIGDLSGIMENLPKGDAVEFKYDDKTNMKSDMVNVLGRLPVAIAVVGNKYFARIVPNNQ